MRINERVEGSSNVLILAEPPAAQPACHQLTNSKPPKGEAVIAVTLTRSVANQLEAWRDQFDKLPANAVIIAVGDTGRKALHQQPRFQHARTTTESLSLETVSSPADLTGLGITLTEYVTEFGDRQTDSTLCFQSITTLCEYVKIQRVFQFFHVFTTHVRSESIRAHYHMNPKAHDAKHVNALKALFDAVVTLDSEDQYAVTTR